MLVLFNFKKVITTGIFFIKIISFGQNPSVNSNFYKAYKDLPIIEYANNAYDLDNKICNYLSSAESFDKKLAVVDAFNTSGEEKAGNLFLTYLKHKHNINRISQIKNIEDKLILSYLLITSDIELSKQILKDNFAVYNNRLSFAILNFLVNSHENFEIDKCNIWVDFQMLDNKIYKIADFRPSALTIIAKAVDDFKSICSNETLVVTKSKRDFTSSTLFNSFPIRYENGVYKINLNINKSVKLDFILDSGASVVLIPEDVFRVLVRNGTISKNDIIGNKIFTIADGTSSSRIIFKIKYLTIGNITVSNIEAAVGEPNSDLLLGQSFIKKFKSVKIDNENKILTIEL